MQSTKRHSDAPGEAAVGRRAFDVRRFHKRLADAAVDLIPRGARMVAAVSGGPDSTAMLHGLLAVREILDRDWSVEVAHLDHRLRPESVEDAAFVRRGAEALRLPAHLESIDVAAAAGETGESIEECGRRLRYAFLTRVANRIGAGVVAVGHTADDQAETVLHRLIRGTSLRGLAGMPASRALNEADPIRLVRPMLTFRRQETAAYLRARNIPWRDDATNEDPSRSTRNWLRLELIRLLECRLNPKVVAALCRLAEDARSAGEVLHDAASEALASARLDQNGRALTLDARRIAGLPAVLRGEVIVVALDHLGVPRKSIGAERIEAAARLAEGNGRRRAIQLPGGAGVERRGRRLTIYTAPLDSAQSPIAERSIEHPCP